MTRHAVPSRQGFARVEVLDPIAKKFSEAEDKAAVIAEAEAAAAGLEEEEAKANAAYYIKFMQKAVEKVRTVLLACSRSSVLETATKFIPSASRGCPASSACGKRHRRLGT
jgi:hypothetical protein